MRRARRPLCWLGLLVAGCLATLTAIPATAGAVGELRFDACLTGGGAVGCQNAAPAALQTPGPIAVAPSGAVYVGARGLNAVTHFFAASNGQLALDGCVSDNGTGGNCTDIPGASQLTGVSDVAVAPSGAVYATAAGAGTISHFFAAPGGQISWDGCVSNDGLGGNCADIPGAGTPLAGVRSVAVAPSGAVYTGSFTAGNVSHFFAAPGGQITFDGCVSSDGSGGTCADVPGGGTPLANVNSVAVGPNGAVYAGTDGNVSHFFAAPGGQIAFDGCVSNDGSGGTCADIPGGGTPLGIANVTVASTGAVYAASALGLNVSHFFAAPEGQITWDGCVSNDGSGGTCADIPGGGAPLTDSAAAAAASPDGRSLYAVGLNSVVAFTLAPGGQVVYQGCYGNDASNGCVDLPGAPITGADDVAVSRDGGSVYVTARDSRSITHFFRTQAPGAGGAGPGGGGAGGGPGGGGAGGGATRCAGRAATLVGTPGDDRLTGTAKADVIVGLGGRDRIKGLGGNDAICGGAGRDRLSGGVGNDRLLGGADADSLDGGLGVDRLSGDAGPDTLAGGPGADALSGGIGSDILRGGAGKDRLLGGAGVDRLLGGAGRDVLQGGAGRNVLVPGPQA